MSLRYEERVKNVSRALRGVCEDLEKDFFFSVSLHSPFVSSRHFNTRKFWKVEIKSHKSRVTKVELKKKNFKKNKNKNKKNTTTTTTKKKKKKKKKKK